MLLARNLQNSGNCLVVILEYMSHVVRNVLGNQDDPHVVPIGEVAESLLNLYQLRISLYNEKVGGVRRSVANASK